MQRSAMVSGKVPLSIPASTLGEKRAKGKRLAVLPAPDDGRVAAVARVDDRPKRLGPVALRSEQGVDFVDEQRRRVEVLGDLEDRGFRDRTRALGLLAERVEHFE